jgi:hypothetical protein
MHLEEEIIRVLHAHGLERHALTIEKAGLGFAAKLHYQGRDLVSYGLTPEAAFGNIYRTLHSVRRDLAA